MRSSEVQISEILKRSEKLNELHSVRKNLLIDITASFAVVFLIVLVGFFIPRVSFVVTEAGITHFGGLILNTSYLGYVVIGILAFVLGVLITVLCLHLKDLRILNADNKEK